jgi:hypothetical protein
MHVDIYSAFSVHIFPFLSKQPKGKRHAPSPLIRIRASGDIVTQSATFPSLFVHACYSLISAGGSITIVGNLPSSASLWVRHQPSGKMIFCRRTPTIGKRSALTEIEVKLCFEHFNDPSTLLYRLLDRRILRWVDVGEYDHCDGFSRWGEGGLVVEKR